MRISRHKEVVPGDLRTVVGRLRDWAVAQAERAPDRGRRRCHKAPSPLQRLSLHPPAAASIMFFTCGPNEAMVVSGKSCPSP